MEKKWNIDEMEVIIVPEPETPLMRKAKEAIEHITDELIQRQDRINRLERALLRNYFIGLVVGSVGTIILSRIAYGKEE